jgi:hypothetical protein
MYIYIMQCMHCIYDCNQPHLTVLTSYTLVACNNYITIRIYLLTNQRLLCNKCIALSNTWSCHMYTFPPPNIYDISTWNLKFKNLKFGRETFKQVTHGNISTNLPQCINDLHALMFIVKKFKMNLLKKSSYSKKLCIS